MCSNHTHTDVLVNVTIGRGGVYVALAKRDSREIKENPRFDLLLLLHLNYDHKKLKTTICVVHSG